MTAQGLSQLHRHHKVTGSASVIIQGQEEELDVRK